VAFAKKKKKEISNGKLKLMVTSLSQSFSPGKESAEWHNTK
jgi:hypothetical protein